MRATIPVILAAWFDFHFHNPSRSLPILWDYDCGNSCCPWLERIGNTFKRRTRLLLLRKIDGLRFLKKKKRATILELFFLFLRSNRFLEREVRKKKESLFCGGAQSTRQFGRPWISFDSHPKPNLFVFWVFWARAKWRWKTKDEKLITMSSLDMNIHHIMF
jgi:hypothetical protein